MSATRRPPEFIEVLLPVWGERYTQTFKYTPLIPANAGIQNACCLMPWTPAFAGVSGEMDGHVV